MACSALTLGGRQSEPVNCGWRPRALLASAWGAVLIQCCPIDATDRPTTIARTGTWVFDNLNKPLNLRVLAEQVAMSPRNFARIFTKEMNSPPQDLWSRLRVEAARRRLEESQNSLERIATECGFGSVNSMRSVFQRTLKIAPEQYRHRVSVEFAFCEAIVASSQNENLMGVADAAAAEFAKDRPGIQDCAEEGEDRMPGPDGCM